MRGRCALPDPCGLRKDADAEDDERHGTGHGQGGTLRCRLNFDKAKAMAIKQENGKRMVKHERSDYRQRRA
jgi:hypothetical protein